VPALAVIDQVRRFLLVCPVVSNGFRGYNSFGEVVPGPKSCGFGQVVPYGMAWNPGGLALS